MVAMSRLMGPKLMIGKPRPRRPSVTSLSWRRNTTWIMYTMNAPAAAPQMLPMPPMITIASTVNETVK
jgi:hypothetical protein